jgi:hypothetical protein
VDLETRIELTETPEYVPVPVNPEYVDKIRQVVQMTAIYQIPGKSPVEPDQVETSSRNLAYQYDLALENEANYKVRLKEFIDLLDPITKDENWLARVEKLLSNGPFEVAPLKFVYLLVNTPPEIRKKLALFLVKNLPEHTLEEILDLVSDFPLETYLEIAKLGLEVAPGIATLSLASNLNRIHKDHIEQFVILILTNGDEYATEYLTSELSELPKSIRATIAELILLYRPNEVEETIVENIDLFPVASRSRLINLALNNNPKEAAPEIFGILNRLPREISRELKNKLLSLEIAPEEVGREIIANLSNYPKRIIAELVRKILSISAKRAGPILMHRLGLFPLKTGTELMEIAFENAPQEVAPNLIYNLEYFPIKVREKLALRALKANLIECGPKLILVLHLFPFERRTELAFEALKASPKEVTARLLDYFLTLPIAEMLELSRKALKIAPLEFSVEIVKNFNSFPNEQIIEAFEANPEETASMLIYRKNLFPLEIQEKIIDALIAHERKKITKSENLNPVLYSDLSGLEDNKSIKEFPKTGSKTFLLGGTQVNKVILRVIPNYAFISWVKAYAAVEEWRNAGFDYVPIEPILKANIYADNDNAEVYTGVLGINADQYIEMYSTIKHRPYVLDKIDQIKEVLTRIGIDHRHVYHKKNFCVQHNRTPDGAIDWDTPPKVFCIDFDIAISNPEDSNRGNYSL